MLNSKQCLTGILLLACCLLAGCNFPAFSNPTEPSIDPVLTDAAKTIAVRLTSEARDPLPTATLGWAEYSPTPPLNETAVIPAETVIPGETPQPTTTAPCDDKAHFVADVNYPDGTQVEPGVEFIKTWRLLNTGTCTWNESYAIVFERGDAMGASASLQLTSVPIPPQGEVDISVNFKAPEADGIYQGYWRLRNPAGVKFGTGEQGDKEFWVKINVGIEPGVGYDFIAQASKASWVSSGGGNDVSLNFGGDDHDPNGVAKLKQDITLENHSEAGVTLVMHPMHVDNGKITGTFPEYTVRSGDLFKSRLGFLEDCGIGKVIFQLWYRQGDSQNLLAEWMDACDGNLVSVETDLSSLVGKKVQFMLVVLADGTPMYDMAIWGSPRIER